MMLQHIQTRGRDGGSWLSPWETCLHPLRRQEVSIQWGGLVSVLTIFAVRSDWPTGMMLVVFFDRTTLNVLGKPSVCWWHLGIWLSATFFCPLIESKGEEFLFLQSEGDSAQMVDKFTECGFTWAFTVWWECWERRRTLSHMKCLCYIKLARKFI